METNPRFRLILHWTRLGLALETTGMVAWEWNPVNDRVTTTGDMPRVFGGTVQSSGQGLGLVSPEDAAAHGAKVERIGREGGFYHSEFRIRRMDTGDTAWLEERATGITDEGGRVVCVVGVVADVTERKNIEEEMRRKNEELTKVNQELEEFAYAASHDLQEPLRMINIYTQLLLRQGGLRDDPQTQQQAEFVRKGVLRMEQLIGDLLIYSRVVHPEQETAATADLSESLDEALTTLQVRLEETGAAILRQPLPKVVGDAGQLALVFQNLLSNALKYRSQITAPLIEISVEEGWQEWLVHIRDNGIGFPPSKAELIFGLFKRLHKNAYPGTGLGLAICKRIVERYGGRIWAESGGEGCGSVFSIGLRKAEV